MIGFLSKEGMLAASLGIVLTKKVTAALRMLAYKIPADLLDDYQSMGES
jgi:hypothetical protein